MGLTLELHSIYLVIYITTESRRTPIKNLNKFVYPRSVDIKFRHRHSQNLRQEAANGR